MTLFGDRGAFAIEVDPLPGPPREPDPAAAATWAALQIWVAGGALAGGILGTLVPRGVGRPVGTLWLATTRTDDRSAAGVREPGRPRRRPR